MVVTPAPTLPPPTPAGMQEMPPLPPLPPDKTADDCNPTASLRPFSDPADADAAVANIRARGQADRRPGHRQQPVQLPRSDQR